MKRVFSPFTFPFFLLLVSLSNSFIPIAIADPTCDASTYVCGNVCCPRDQDCTLTGDGSGTGECKSAPIVCYVGQVMCYNQSTLQGSCCVSSTFTGCGETGCIGTSNPTEGGGPNLPTGIVGPIHDPQYQTGAVNNLPERHGPSLQLQNSPSTIVSDICGNGKVHSVEQCDDGNNQNGDGCSSKCTVETCYTCTGSPSICRRQATCLKK